LLQRAAPGQRKDAHGGKVLHSKSPHRHLEALRRSCASAAPPPRDPWGPMPGSCNRLLRPCPSSAKPQPNLGQISAKSRTNLGQSSAKSRPNLGQTSAEPRPNLGQTLVRSRLNLVLLCRFLCRRRALLAPDGFVQVFPPPRVQKPGASAFLSRRRIGGSWGESGGSRGEVGGKSGGSWGEVGGKSGGSQGRPSLKIAFERSLQ
jgi:hypothetical protein